MVKSFSKKDTIAYIIFRTRENTGSKVVFHQAAELMKKGYVVNIYTLFGKTAPWFPKGIQVISIFKFFFSSPPDVLIATFWPTAYVMLFLPAKKKFYFVMGWEEDFYSNKILKTLAKLTYKLPFKKIVVSDYLEKKIRESNKKKNKIYKINAWSLNPDFISQVRKPSDKNASEVKILSVISWYNRAKGPDLLVKAIGKLKLKHPEYHFTLASREKKTYSSLINSFIPNPGSSELAKLYQNSHILLVTSRSEGFYIPGVEAMASGCPVITTNSGGVLEYARNNVNSIILNRLEDLWENDIIEKLLKTPSLRNKLIKNGYKTSKEYFKKSSGIGVSGLLKIFNKV